MKLVIVESPTKSNTLQRFLGREYTVRSSFGHIRDLPEDEFGVDIENDFKPKYIIPSKSKKVIQTLKKEAQKAKTTILATDEDREGEAIAWHLSQALGLKNPKRIVFHEITKSAIQEALKNPRDIDMNLVDSQQARRILDRIVGYKLSPFLWKKVARRLSAGRVQSVAVRLVAEREREIENFIPQEYWFIEASLRKQFPISNFQFPNKSKIPNIKSQTEFKALLVKKDGKTIPKLGIKTKKEADKIVKDLKGAEYKIGKVEKKEIKRNPLPPFTTSTLQQEAWKRFRFPAKFTMRVAQQLYEKGHITYHRTDSLNLSNLSLFAAKKFIETNYGKKYWAGFLRKYKAKGRAQEAHEAIRPTRPNFAPQNLGGQAFFKDRNEERLYDLIWRRFIACQMAQASFDSTTVEVEASNKQQETKDKYTFRATGQILKFDGFLKVYLIKFAVSSGGEPRPKEREEAELPSLKEGEILELLKLISSQHFTQPPSRYTEATLIKTLEENGIGRPSTYAPTLSTIQNRNYIEKNEQKKFCPTEIGTVVNDLLVAHFPKIVDIEFTAKMEDDLDKIAQGKEKWTGVCGDFYGPFEKNLKKKYKEVSKKDITDKPTKKKCPKCGSSLLIRLGKFGRFYACSKFPKCKYTESLKENTLGIKCPKCAKGKIVEKRTRLRRGFGGQAKPQKIFYGCDQFPECDFALWDRPTGEKCPECDSLLVETKKGIKCSNKNCQFEKNMVE